METVINLNRIRFDEKLSLNLRNIYDAYGYLPYKMSKFEEYDLYSKNKDFLGDGGILTFTDVNGHLMALKPDVTLSIVKNSKGSSGTQKVYYKENVYRTSKNGGGFKEIQQCGVECIGDVDKYEVVEVLLLALKSLKATGRPFKLEISHMGILSALMSEATLTDIDMTELVTCIKRNFVGLLGAILFLFLLLYAYVLLPQFTFILICMFVFSFLTYLGVYCAYPILKKYVIDPYYEEHPDEMPDDPWATEERVFIHRG